MQQYKKRVWHVAFQFTGRADEAEELTQEIFLHLLGALKSFDSSGSLPAWIQRVARNYSIDHYRRRRRERSMVQDGVVYYIESRRFLIRDSPRPATTYEQKTGGADGVKGA